jgi:hypothetical protein
MVITYNLFYVLLFSVTPDWESVSQSVQSVQSVTTFIDVEFCSVLIIILFSLWRKFVIFPHGVSYHPLSSTQVPTTTQISLLLLFCFLDTICSVGHWPLCRHDLINCEFKWWLCQSPKAFSLFVSKSFPPTAVVQIDLCFTWMKPQTLAHTCVIYTYLTYIIYVGMDEITKLTLHLCHTSHIFFIKMDETLKLISHICLIHHIHFTMRWMNPSRVNLTHMPYTSHKYYTKMDETQNDHCTLNILCTKMGETTKVYLTQVSNIT